MFKKLTSLACVGFLLTTAASRAENISLVGWYEDTNYVTANQNSQRSSSNGDMLNKISDPTWTKYRDTTSGETDKGLHESQQLPHMVKSGEMISYEDTQSIPPKVRWFRGKGLQGYLIWDIGQDYNGTTNLLLDSARAVW